ncbi:uncharacterized protein BDZ99DRAFT_496032 [Mytilinidion resinicola]|uniref:DUF7730 domain-containing protein n=1 Tax=Mytilinidion resinicola TaxID=574789 RepID=A0A6A6YVV3_9PEZI|nr:uncharacterized protein BDZ99DRAFT_496032 [Mytilinidion resinicola]KAF2812900.1 hypothetical protein BDZ99DRAFT_496032 [Mytilinidion resinicola]
MPPKKRSLRSAGAAPKRQKPKPRRLLPLRRPNAASRELRERIVSESPLLRLPAELRRHSFEFVLGGALIHIHREDGKVQLYPCISTISEDEAYAQSKVPLDIRTDDDIPPFADRHDNCTPSLTRLGRERQKLRRVHRHQPLHLGLLRVCTQVYYETALLPFNSNVFAAKCGPSLSLFLASLLTQQRRELRALHFDIPCRTTLEEWNDHITPNLVKSIPGLRVVHLDMALYQIGRPIYNINRHPAVQASGYALFGVLRLQRLPLERSLW